MRLRHIEVFHAIYTSGSITNAANLLCVSQPSVSKVLAHAEMQLGFKLFDRNKGKLIPTSEAHLLFSEVDKAYKQLFSIKKLSENIKHSEHGTINIAITPALGFDLIPRAVANFRQTHPNIQFQIQTLHNEEAAQALLEHRCDLAILFESPSIPQVSEIELGSSEIVVVYPTAVFPDLPTTIETTRLLEQELIGIWNSGPLGEMVFNRLNRGGATISSAINVDTYYIATGLVQQGIGCCTIDLLTAQANRCDKVGIASFCPPLPFHIKALHMESRPLSRACLEFLQFTEKELAIRSEAT
ncbi:LysR family transcriptional regulator [Alteromonas sediminis]|uniref:LysR family transcriptional regulator n=1 Tax=Alteromonas sediminis TaxID=2259342 RepID=A0A3N5YCN2_9ALTE|nr:LysR family transcriptional regulator [Alteromonas sediminis]RPJ67045.1 LysR family transcriptional regulator [Alteromonas sediminis]